MVGSPCTTRCGPPPGTRGQRKARGLHAPGVQAVNHVVELGRLLAREDARLEGAECRRTGVETGQEVERPGEEEREEHPLLAADRTARDHEECREARHQYDHLLVVRHPPSSLRERTVVLRAFMHYLCCSWTCCSVQARTPLREKESPALSGAESRPQRNAIRARYSSLEPVTVTSTRRLGSKHLIRAARVFA
jgi:hypothetical protein